MKATGILFTAEMVRAEREGRKTETRRLQGLEWLNDKPGLWSFIGKNHMDSGIILYRFGLEGTENVRNLICPYGQPGDLLYIKETWGVAHVYNDVKPSLIDFRQKALPTRWWAADCEKPTWIGKTRAAIHLPMDAARTWLKIISITPERLQDITQESAVNEGILWYSEGDGAGSTRYKDYMADASGYGHPDHDYPTVGTPKESFRTLIQSIHGPEVWDLNKWVWAVKFQRTDERP